MRRCSDGRWQGRANSTAAFLGASSAGCYYWFTMAVQRDVAAPLEREGVTYTDWGIEIRHPNGAVTHLPPGTELDDEHLQDTHEVAELVGQVYPPGYDIDKGR